MAVGYGPALARYGFGRSHPFGPDRQEAWWREMTRRGLHERVEVVAPSVAGRDAVEAFHTAAYIDKVERLSAAGGGMLDKGDTPAFPGVFEVGSTVVGTALDVAERVMTRRVERGFVGIGGLHHARRDTAAGFCVFNDCGAVIEALLGQHGLSRVAYVDIDAHHGDGVYYDFVDDPRVAFADIHQDGRTLYPGTGHAFEVGKGLAEGTKLNVPLPPGADDGDFERVWPAVLAHLRELAPEFIILQCGADSIAGDPITQMAFTASVHGRAAASLCALADETAGGRILGLGGGGYNRTNLALGWTNVVEAFLGA